MSDPMTVEIPLEIDRRITPNSRSHWTTRHRITREMKNTTYETMQATGPHSALHNASLPLTLNYVVVRGFRRKKMDDDNIKASLKYVQDGIAAYLGINDKHMIIGTVEQVSAGKGNQPFVRVMISSQEAA